jgi:error-prone DNA polymerase
MTAPHAMARPAYAELQVTSNFSFLRGGSHAEELVATAKVLGLAGIAITDRNTLAGVVRAHLAARAAGMRLVIGARLDLTDAPSLLCFPTDRAAYGRLCRLLTLGQRRAGKGQCTLALADVAAHAQGQIFIIVPPDAWDWRAARQTGDHHAGRQPSAPVIPLMDHRQPRARQAVPASGTGTAINARAEGAASHTVDLLERDDPARASIGIGGTRRLQPALSVAPGIGHAADFAHDLTRIRSALTPAPAYLAASMLHRGDDRARLNALAELSQRAGTPLVATGDVLYHSPERRPLQDVLTCIRQGTTINQAGFRLEANAERHVKPPGEVQRLFRGHEAALARTIDILKACRFSLDELVYEYPDEPVPAGMTPQSRLAELTWEGAAWRFPDGIPPAVRATLEKELALIAELRYAPYFLTVHDIVQFARSRNILCQGRGSAANSAVCYCLAITSVNPMEVDLLFERFISPERKEPPDIDVDFEHERREEVIQYIYARYGRERAGLAATVIAYRARSAVREVGKVMGLSPDVVAALAGMVWGTRPTPGKGGGVLPEQHVREAGLDPNDPLLVRVLELTGALIGFPRHLSQHVGGFVLTRGPLCEVVPIGNAAMDDRTVIEWDKDDLDALGLLKVDVLALGMLTCIRKAFDLLAQHYGRHLTLGTVPRNDATVYDMLCRADSLGVFQVESRAQMNMLPRLKPRTFYDLVIEVAIVRPGPIQGDMVHPYLRRRAGIEPELYPSPALEHGPADELRQILGKTKGVPLFQEQAMRIAMVAAQFSAVEANELRRAMATFRRRGTIHLLEEKMVSRMVARGYEADFAQRCFDQIKGFGEYGFPESHAASFALLVYVSSWLKCHYPDVFAAALLNAQPMGFYAPAQIVRDAREHGVEARPADVNHSQWDATLEKLAAPSTAPSCALRLGLRQIDGLPQAEAARLTEARYDQPFADVEALRRRAGLKLSTLETLAAADTFRSLGADRRQALWQVKALPSPVALPLFEWAQSRETGDEPDTMLPDMPLSEHVVNDYQTLRLSLKAHPLSFLRTRLMGAGMRDCRTVAGLADGTPLRVAGVVLVRQRPGTAKGVVFMTIEDETGVVNAVIWPDILERFRRVVMGARLVAIEGRVQRHENIVHVVSVRLADRSDWLAQLADGAALMKVPIARADEVLRPEPGSARGAAHSHPRAARIIPRSRDFH